MTLAWVAALAAQAPADRAENGALPPIAALELRGIARDGRQWRFGLRDVANRQSVWLAVGDSYRDWIVRAYDPATESVLVECHGTLLRLTIGGAAANVPAFDSSEAPQDIRAESRHYGIDRPGFGGAR